jgi:outer membrane protein assembly factor BamB
MLEDDSVHFEIIAQNGDLVGIIPLENHILFNAEYSTYELYGNSPSNFDPQFVSQSKGVLDAKSQVEADKAVLELCKDGINAYSGSKPRLISFELNETYVSGAAGTDGRFYYISLYNGSEYNLYVYDTMLGIWSREDSLQVTDFTLMDGYLYALASDNKIYKFNSGTETIIWYFETEKLTNDYLGQKGTAEIKIEADLEEGTIMKVYLSLDDRDYSLVNTVIKTGHAYHKACVIPEDAYYFKIKTYITGDGKVYSASRDIVIGAD